MPLSDRRFGLELEFNSTGFAVFSAVASFLRGNVTAYAATQVYHISNGEHWDLKPDASCGLELASPALRWDHWPEVEKVCKFLGQYPVQLDCRCSVHVHHEVNDYSGADLTRLFRLWVAVEPLSMLLCDITRRNNIYCRRWRPFCPSWGYVFQQSSGRRVLRRLTRDAGRRMSLNLLPYWRRGTVEVRLHHGSVNSEELYWWTLYTQALVELSKHRLRTATLQRLYESPNADRVTQLHELVNRYYPSTEVDRVFSTIPERLDSFEIADPITAAESFLSHIRYEDSPPYLYRLPTSEDLEQCAVSLD